MVSFPSVKSRVVLATEQQTFQGGSSLVQLGNSSPGISADWALILLLYFSFEIYFVLYFSLSVFGCFLLLWLFG